MAVNLILAVGLAGEIGKKGDLIWKIPEDLKRFKRLTTGHTVVMGRKTWESLPRHPLPNRRNILITRDREYTAPGAVLAHSLEKAMALATGASESDKIFIIGGASIYEAALPFTDMIDLTVVEATYPDADTWFRIPTPEEWEIVEESPLLTDEVSQLKYRHILLRRK